MNTRPSSICCWRWGIFRHELLGDFPPHPGRRPLGVAPVRARHVLGDYRVPMPRVRADMARHTSALVQNLDRGVGDARLELFADEA